MSFIRRTNICCALVGRLCCYNSSRCFIPPNTDNLCTSGMVLFIHHLCCSTWNSSRRTVFIRRIQTICALNLWWCNLSIGCATTVIHGVTYPSNRNIHLADIVRTSCGHLADILRTSCGHRADILRTSCGHLADILRTSCGHRADILRTSCGHLADACEV